MNMNWDTRVAEERRKALLNEAQQARLEKEAGIRAGEPGALKALALAVVSLPFVFLLARTWLKI